MTNTPNHAQTARISADLSALKQGKPIEHWQGNSYRGVYISGPESGHYRLIHWDTEIARFDQAGVCIYFDARYHSSTTRSFQGRILMAMQPGDIMIDAVVAELGKPTGTRRYIYRADF